MHRLPLRRLILVLLATACSAAAWARGSVVAMGGAVQPASPLWAEVVALAGVPSPRFVLFTMSSEVPDESAAALSAELARHGASALHVRVGPRVSGGALEQAVSDPHWIELVERAHGAVFSGGNQSLITATLAPAGRETPLLAALRGLLARGGVVAGSSAGAAVMSRRMFTGGDPLAVLQGVQREEIVAPGLGFIDGDLLVDQHFVRRGRVGRLLPTLQRLAIGLGIGVDEDSAIIVQDRQLRVLGTRGALVVDLRQAGRDSGLSEFNLHGARLSWLEAGDRLDLDTLEVTPAPAKRGGRRVAPPPAGFRPYWQERAFVADVLADFAIVGAMQRLVDSPHDEVRGLAFDPSPAPDAPRAELGFEWILSRAADTSAWNAGDRYSIARVRLEVRPVRIARPWFTPWR